MNSIYATRQWPLAFVFSPERKTLPLRARWRNHGESQSETFRALAALALDRGLSKDPC